MPKQEKNHRCPCCGTPTEERIGQSGNECYLGPVQQAVFNAVRMSPHGIGHEALYARVWGNRVLRSGSIVPVTIRFVNKKISRWGLKIKGTGGPGSIYRLLDL